MLNDPLFLKHPKGVVPTARAAALAEPIARLLAQARQVVASADPFDPSRSTRRFAIGASDGMTAVVVPRLFAALRQEAPGVELGLRDLQPPEALGALDAREIDVALHPLDDLPARCVTRRLYDEDFVIVARRGHPFARSPTLERYCAAQHVLVSHAGDPHGFVDNLLAQKGVSRRVTLTVPTFLWALLMVSDSDLLAAVPRTFARERSARFGVAVVEPPLELGTFTIHAVARDVAMMDAGVAWLMDLIERSAGASARAKRRR
jgi:DNA-binding transcriptional LysR family regulator